MLCRIKMPWRKRCVKAIKLLFSMCNSVKEILPEKQWVCLMKSTLQETMLAVNYLYFHPLDLYW